MSWLWVWYVVGGCVDDLRCWLARLVEDLLLLLLFWWRCWVREVHVTGEEPGQFVLLHGFLSDLTSLYCDTGGCCAAL